MSTSEILLRLVNRFFLILQLSGEVFHWIFISIWETLWRTSCYRSFCVSFKDFSRVTFFNFKLKLFSNESRSYYQSVWFGLYLFFFFSGGGERISSSSSFSSFAHSDSDINMLTKSSKKTKTKAKTKTKRRKSNHRNLLH